MTLPFGPPIEPMLATPRDDLPAGEGWLYEPKWDGFRCIAFRDGRRLHLQSRKLQPLERYFPELVAALAAALPAACVVDGEIVVPGRKSLDFDALLQRIHPAASRIERLARETPSRFVAFDLLALGRKDLRAKPLVDRRAALDAAVPGSADVFRTPQTASLRVAKQWFRRFEGAGLDGIVAKRADLPYVEGERLMVKVKHRRTIDCVIGGWRKASTGGGIGSILLGLYDEHGVLHHVGHVSALDEGIRAELAPRLARLTGGESFGRGRTPGATSRWSTGRDPSWIAVTPRLVVEVAVDQVQGDRLRHAARFVRWRPDKAARDCTVDQLRSSSGFRIEDIIALGRSGAPREREAASAMPAATPAPSRARTRARSQRAARRVPRPVPPRKKPRA